MTEKAEKGKVIVMCMWKVSCDAMTLFAGRPCIKTERRFGAPYIKGETPKQSLIVYTNTNKLRVDSNERKATGEEPKIVDLNPYEPVLCPGLLKSMELGLSETAAVWWVNPMKKFGSDAPKDIEVLYEEVDGKVAAEMKSQYYSGEWDLSSTRALELAPPRDAEQWLVRQPLVDAEHLCWDALQRDALGIWKTAENVYFVIPVGYRNILWGLEDDETITKEAFYAANAQEFRDICQQPLDAFVDAERRRSKKLPELQASAAAVVEEFALVAEALAKMQGTELPRLGLDAENENFIFNGEFERLTEGTLEKFTGMLNQLREQRQELEACSRRADGFREILREANVKITIKDVYGVLVQTMPAKRFGKTVEVDLRSEEAVITVLKGGEVKQASHFRYDEVRSADRFNAELERLKVKQREDYDYDYDDIPHGSSLFAFFSSKQFATRKA